MKFKSQWISTCDFENLKPIDMYHRHFEEKEIPKSSFENYHACFRKRFTLENADDMYINISADDYYKLYINGSFVCQGPASAYPENYNFNTVSVTPYIKKGENIIAVHVYYHGKVGRAFFSGDNRMGLVADVYKNNSFLFGTDESWLYKRAEEFSGEPIGYDTQFAENIDFCKKDTLFKSLCADESGYKNAVIYKSDHIFESEAADNVDVYYVKPKEVTEFEKGKFFIDFGEEISGSVYFKIRGKKGEKAYLLCGEEQGDTPYSVRCEMRCNCTYREELTLSGGVDEAEFFDYKVFRYANIFAGEKALITEISAQVRHHRFCEKTVLCTEAPDLENIWKICRNGVKICAQEALLDCASREKGAYLGDFLISGLAHLYLTGDGAYYKKNMYDYAHTSRVSKGLLAVANGSYMQEFADYSLLFPLAVQNYLKVTDDRDSVRDLYPVLLGILEEFEKYKREDGLLQDVTDIPNLVDWPKNLRDGYSGELDEKNRGFGCHNVLNAFYIGAHKTVEKIALELGIDKKECSTELEKAYINAFYNEKTGIFCDTEDKAHSTVHSNALPLFFEIARADMRGSIKDFIMEKGLCCGVYMAYFVICGLGKIGAFDEMISLILNDGEHSWINMIREGATTCFEAWGKEQKWNTSLCHAWASTPIIAICEYLNRKTYKDKVIKIKEVKL